MEHAPRHAGSTTHHSARGMMTSTSLPVVSPPRPRTPDQEVDDVRHQVRRRAVVMVFAVAGLAGSAPPAVGKPLEATGVSQDPEGSGEVTTPAPPPDPVGDIDPVRPSEETGIQPLAVPVRSIRFPLA